LQLEKHYEIGELCKCKGKEGKIKIEIPIGRA
jgi:hypothetical protein